MHSFYVKDSCEGSDGSISGDSVDVTLASYGHYKFAYSGLCWCNFSLKSLFLMHSFYVIVSCEGSDERVSGDSVDVTLARVGHYKLAFLKIEVFQDNDYLVDIFLQGCLSYLVGLSICFVILLGCNGVSCLFVFTMEFG